VRFCAASDQSLLVYLGEEIGLPAHERVLKLLRSIEKKPPVWLRNVQPAYCSLLVSFDASRADHAEVEATLHKYEGRAKSTRASKHKTVEIPVCYGDEFGPDLEEVATIHRLTTNRVIELHCSRTYHAYFLGFAPGFAYLGELSEEIGTPRLANPRRGVPAGSVAIAGKQTGIYPFSTPGGWRLLGRTPLPIFQTNRKPMQLISIGDQVRFRPISRQQFITWSERR
jgi:inhibitor of KinA